MKVKYISRQELISIVESCYENIGWPNVLIPYGTGALPSYKIVEGLPYLTRASELRNQRGEEFDRCIKKWKRIIH